VLHISLEYRIERLVSSGMVANIAAFTNEIDNLLAYCHSTFA